MISWDKDALKDIKKLPSKKRKSVVEKVNQYLTGEKPTNQIKALRGTLGKFRLRVGAYRVIFTRRENKILVLAVRHRKDIYRGNSFLIFFFMRIIF